MPAISLSTPYTQSFDTLSSSGTSNSWLNDSTLTGWFANRSAYRAGTGSDTTGALYSFGDSSDRALGSLASGSTNTIYYGVLLANDTNAEITSLSLQYTGEQWRNGGNTTQQKLDFAYQIGTGLTDITSGTWVDANELDFLGPIATSTASALNGNLSANQKAISGVINISLDPGEQIFLRWEDINDLGNDHGLAIDTLNISAGNAPTPVIRIYDIQGVAHISPLNGQTVSDVRGVVTAVSSNGFYLQEPVPDNNPATSEGIFVFTGTNGLRPQVGNSLLVNGTVSEFRPASNSNNLTTTQISNPSFTLLSEPLPSITPIILGNGGRPIPNTIIAGNLNEGNVETPGTPFIPSERGIDFYESLEGMLVRVNDTFATSPNNSFGEVWVLADKGANATGKTANGGSLISPTDFNPERIQIDQIFIPSANRPAVNVGDSLGTVTGVIDYNFNNFEIRTLNPLTPTPGNLSREKANITLAPDKLTIGGFNVENLSPLDPASKFTGLAEAIVGNLKSPDILALEEVQDNTGPTDDGVVAAEQTYGLLINAIAAAGGPTYEFRQINPINNTNGGQPGGNIRVGFLFNPSRVSFTDKPGGNATTDTTVSNVNGVPQLSASPGLLDPNNPAFDRSRRPLVGEFVFNGEPVFIVGNHFNSKGGDQPLFGPNQPPTLSSEVQRQQQAAVVAEFVEDVLEIDPQANVVVLGDLNDFEFSRPVQLITAAGLTNLHSTLPANERYTYNFQGNAQVLDHILVSENLQQRLDAFDVVHINSEFSDQISDHDPYVASFKIPAPVPLPPSQVFGTTGNDFFDAAVPDGKQFIGKDQILFTSSGNDTVDVAVTVGGNRIDLGSGDDLLFAGTNNRIIAGSGSDRLFLGNAGGNNVVTGGSGADQFWLLTDNEDLPTAANRITDFTPGVDVLGFGATGLNFNALTLTQVGQNTIVKALGQDIAILQNVLAANLNADNFVFA